MRPPQGAVPPFVAEEVLRGLTEPTALAFAPDGSLYVAQKAGQVLRYASLADRTPALVLDLSAEVHSFHERGLLGMTLDPAFPARPYLYVLYATEAIPGQPAPTAPPSAAPDTCDSPIGACPCAGRLARLTLSGTDAPGGGAQTLIENWYQEYPSHSVGDLRFDAAGGLLVSVGDGGAYDNPDFYLGPGSPPSVEHEGGAFRAQDPGELASAPWASGRVLRVDPDALARDPWLDPRTPSPHVQELARGLRNPFRLAERPHTRELWVVDVGWNSWEELNRILASQPAPVNFGWPCWEGPMPTRGFQDSPRCAALLAGGATPPWYTYAHGEPILTQVPLRGGSGALTSLLFVEDAPYPGVFRAALYLADVVQGLVWALPTDADGMPDPARATLVLGAAASPVHLVQGPDRKVYVLSYATGALNRLEPSEGLAR